MPKPPPFFVVEGPLEPGGIVSLEGPERRHARARRLGTGDAVRLLDAAGAEAEGAIERSTRDGCTIRVGAVRRRPAEPGVEILVAAIRAPRLAWLVEKATEIGAAAVTIVGSERSQRRRVEDAGNDLARLVRIAREAAAQSGQSTPPAIAGPIPPDEALARARSSASAILLDASGDPFPGALAAPAAVWVGPEGGWSPEEIARSEDAGWRRARLPGATLRTETAAIAALILAVRAIDTARRGSGQ
ncbi:MAG TPA: RsmE family RNA methyltransferase [Thermoanaerobaculia bacterium]|nr:RsmE family RNA methyltransferase [Thermoanaerobaculia bacterium]